MSEFFRFVWYCKTPKKSDTRKIVVLILKFKQNGSTQYYSDIRTKDADGIANRVDPDQTAHLGAVGQSDLGLHRLLRPVHPKT